MTETRSNRHGLPLWSAGSDSGSRADFTEAFTKLNAQAAWDDGTTLTDLPVSDLVSGRYQMVVHGGAYRVLYRRYSDGGGGWDAVGGNTTPSPHHFRGLAAGVARTDAAITFSHPDATNIGGSIGFDGSALLSGTVRVFDDDETARGALMVGTSASVNLSTLGRAHIRTRAAGERAITVQAHASDAGNLFTARSAGSSDVLSVDALGRLRALAPSAFGGAPLPTLASLAVAPTASDDDDTTAGLLLHGSTGSSEITAKAIMRILRQSDDAAPLAEFGRDSFKIGRLPWTGSTITMSANNHTLRVSGAGSNALYWRIRRSDATSPESEANEANDVTLFDVTPNGFTSGMPLYVSNRFRLSEPTVSFYRVTNFSAPFMELLRLVPDGGGEATQLASRWDSDGRLASGTWWRPTGVGTLRDTRQSVRHVCRKVYAAPGDSQTSGLQINPNGTHTLDWTQMTARSTGATDLSIVIGLEFILRPNQSDNEADAQLYRVETLISINTGSGFGSYSTIGVTEDSAATPFNRFGQRYSGNYLTCTHRSINIPSGAAFKLRTVITTASAAPVMWVRSVEVDAQECILENYDSPA